MFRERHLPETQSCISGGIELSGPWLVPIAVLCDHLSRMPKFEVPGEPGRWENPPKVIVKQIKRKFGSLRFYYEFEWPDVVDPAGERFSEVVSKYHHYTTAAVGMAEDWCQWIKNHEKTN